MALWILVRVGRPRSVLGRPVAADAPDAAVPDDPGAAHGLSYGVVFSQLLPRLVSQDADGV